MNTTTLRHEYESWFHQYPFEGMITTRIKPYLPQEEAHRLFIKEILRPLGKSLQTAFASISIIIKGITNHHMHSLILPHRAGAITDNLEVAGVLAAVPNSSKEILRDHANACRLVGIHSNSYHYEAGHIKDFDTTILFYGPNILNRRRII